MDYGANAGHNLHTKELICGWIRLRPCIPNFFPKFELSFELERVFCESRRDEMNVIFFVIFVHYFFVFSETRKNENRKKKTIFANYSRRICEEFAKIAKIPKIHDFRDFREFGNVRKARKLLKYFRNLKNGNFRNSRKRKFRKKRLTQGLKFDDR